MNNNKIFSLIAAFFKGIQLIFAGSYWIYIYPTILTLAIITVSSGFSVADDNRVEFFGKAIPPIGTPADSIHYCFTTFVFHFWCFGLMMISFGGMKPILATWESNFLNFIRYSVKSRLYLEALRLICFAITITIICIPFLAASILGYCQLGMTASKAVHLFLCTTPSLVLTGILIYLAGACKLPEYYSGLFFTTPLLLSGFQMLLVGRGVVSAENWFLPLAPYCYLNPANSAEWTSINMLAITALFVLARLGQEYKTRRIW